MAPLSSLSIQPLTSYGSGCPEHNCLARLRKYINVFETTKRGTRNELTFPCRLFSPSVSGSVTIKTQPYGLSWSLRSERVVVGGGNEGLYLSRLGSIHSSVLPFIEAPLDCEPPENRICFRGILVLASPRSCLVLCAQRLLYKYTWNEQILPVNSHSSF